MNKNTFGLLAFLFSTGSIASATDAPELVQQDQASIEIRTLKAGSAIRSQIERNLDLARMSDNFTLTVVGSPAGFRSGESLIDLLEGTATQKSFITDPYSDPEEPNGPGGVRGQKQSTHSNCATVMNGSTATSANITWNWVWKPDGDTNGDGKVNNSDSCPCSWVLTSTNVEFLVSDQPLEC